MINVLTSNGNFVITNTLYESIKKNNPELLEGDFKKNVFTEKQFKEAIKSYDEFKKLSLSDDDKEKIIDICMKKINQYRQENNSIGPGEDKVKQFIKDSIKERKREISTEEKEKKKIKKSHQKELKDEENENHQLKAFVRNMNLDESKYPFTVNFIKNIGNTFFDKGINGLKMKFKEYCKDILQNYFKESMKKYNITNDDQEKCVNRWLGKYEKSIDKIISSNDLNTGDKKDKFIEIVKNIEDECKKFKNDIRNKENNNH